MSISECFDVDANAPSYSAEVLYDPFTTKRSDYLSRHYRSRAQEIIESSDDRMEQAMGANCE